MREILVFLFVLTLPTTANAALYDRRNGLIYDDDLDITWLQDTNYSITSGYDADGKMTWQDSKVWVSQLAYAGFDNWRLPIVYDINPSGCMAIAYSGTDCGFNVNTSTGEMAHLFYDELGGVAFFDANGNGPQNGYGVPDNSYFPTIEPYLYWAIPDANTTRSWTFNFENGSQSVHNETNEFYAWAVHDGDIGAVPIPAAAWLFGPALFGLGAMKRKRAQKLVNSGK